MNNNIFNNLKQLQRKLNGCNVEYDLKPYYKILTEINNTEQKFKHKTDLQLKRIAVQLNRRVLQKKASLENILVDAFTLVREVAWRTLQMRPYDVQVIGGIALFQGKLIEQQTGEGKTLTAVFPAFLNGLTGKGVHVLTFNDYLARRDANWMGPIYQFLGQTVGFIQEGMSIKERQKAYAADITYLTAKEAGFDFLRDSLCYQKKDMVQRKFNCAIVDEADSILIDEARIPLVIAGVADDYVADTFRLAHLAKKLQKKIDFKFDEYGRNIYLTNAGLKNVEGLLNCDNLYAEENFELLTRLNCALHAQHLLQLDVDYIVRNDKIELVDEFTGRVADKRRWPDGLQAALETKENLTIQSKGNILNSITLQHFLKLYPKICGMTATAQTAWEEFQQFYGLSVTVIPPNKPCLRLDFDDLLFRTKREKIAALLKEIIRVNQTKRPILVGTCSVDESEMLAFLLGKVSIKCLVLNAKNDEFEAQIVAQAGRLSAVTISTNMAGRGTDIRLGGSDDGENSQVRDLGGLYVIGTNKHESQRIDDQLRGRAGRQGDPGSSRFFISLEDDLFIKYRIKDLFPPKVLENNKETTITDAILIREVNRLQRIIEGQNLEIKRTLYRYSHLLESQRQVFFDNRAKAINNNFASEFFQIHAEEKYDSFQSIIGKVKLKNLCTQILLTKIDKFWSLYLDEIADIREGIHLTSIGGRTPFFEFQKLSVELFNKYSEELEIKLIQLFNNLPIRDKNFIPEDHVLKAPTATWTYLINDKSFENLLGLQLVGNIGLSSVAAFTFGPLLGLYPWLLKLGRKKKLKSENK
jgi:preprotein translocase subunit SecA